MPEISHNAIQSAQGMPIFGGLSAATVEYLLQRVGRRRCAKGGYFYHEGDSADSMFVLEAGRVVLVREGGERRFPFKDVGPGDCFGVVALLDFAGRNTSAYAEEDAEALEISAENLYDLYTVSVEQFNLLYMNVAREVCRRLRETDRRLFACWDRSGRGPGGAD